MSWMPHVTVATIIEQNDRFLLVEEESEDGVVFNQPAGHLEANESLPQAAIREAFEETGWHIELSGFLGATVLDAKNGITYVRFTFVGEAIEHDPNSPLDDGILRAVWLTHEEVSERKNALRNPNVLKDIERYLNRDPQPLEMLDYIPLN